MEKNFIELYIKYKQLQDKYNQLLKDYNKLIEYIDFEFWDDLNESIYPQL